MATIDTDSINVILEGESWRFIGTKCSIGIYNVSSSDSITYKIKLTEVLENELLPNEIALKYQIFDEIYSDIDA